MFINRITAVAALLCVFAMPHTVTAFAPVSSIPQKSVVSRQSHFQESPRILTEIRAVPLPSVDTSSLTQYFLETLISNGLPAFFWIVVVAFAAKSIKSAKDAGNQGGPNGGLFSKNAVTEIYDDLYGNPEAQKPMLPFGPGRASNAIPKNLGIPTDQYFKITKLNSKYESFDFSLTAATQSKAKAAAKYRAQTFDSALQRSFDSSIAEINSAQKSDLLTEEKAFLREGGKMLSNLIQLQGTLTELIIGEEMRTMDVEIGEVDAYNGDEKDVIDATVVKKEKDKDAAKKESKKSSKKSNKKDINKLVKEIQKVNTDLLKLEMEFIRAVIEIMGPDRANAIRAALLGNIAGGGVGVAGSLITSLQNRPIAAVLKTIGYSSHEDKSGRNLFVTDFPGDVSASQVETLREEVTAILRAAKPGDEALLTLQTGGGTVTGYGLAAAQLKRFKQKGIKLTICVEQVAASGGYMMTCVADRVIASPFAVLGSIGVISDLPNVYERLKREGIEFQTITAGKYKRTITPTKKVTEEDIAKSKEDIEQILNLFKAFVAENRPSLDIEKVATGETWFGDDAMKMGLCDELRTVDDVLCQYVDEGYNVYSVAYDPTPEASPLLGGLLPATQSNSDIGGGLIQGATKWLVRNISTAVKEEMSSGIQSNGKSVEERYMMRDPSNSADEIKMKL